MSFNAGGFNRTAFNTGSGAAVFICPPVATATAEMPAPTIPAPHHVTINAPVSTATAEAPTPKVIPNTRYAIIDAPTAECTCEALPPVVLDGVFSVTDTGEQEGAAGHVIRIHDATLSYHYYTSPYYDLDASTIHTLSIKARGTIRDGSLTVCVMSWTGTAFQLPISALNVSADFETYSYTFTTTANITGTQQFIRFIHNGSDPGYVDIAEINLTGTAYPVSFTGYGAATSDETLMFPAHLLDEENGAIRMRFKLIRPPGGDEQYLFDAGGPANHNIVVKVNADGRLVVVYGDGTAEQTITGKETVIAEQTWYALSVRWGLGGVVASLNTAQECVRNAPPIDFQFDSFGYIGCKQDGTLQPDAIIDEFLTECRETDDSVFYEAINRDTALTVDGYTLLLMPFDNDLYSKVLSSTFSKAAGTVIIAQEGSSYNIDRADIVVPEGYESANKIVKMCAENNFPTASGSINFAEGTYVLDGSISLVGKDSITIKGQGLNTVLKIKDAATAFKMLYFENCHDIVIEDLVLDGNKDNIADTDDFYGIYVKDCTRFKLKNVTIRNIPTGYACYLKGCSSTNIDTLTIEDCNVGLMATRTSTIQNAICNISNTTVKSCTGDAVTIFYTDYAKLSNVHAEESSYGITLAYSNNCQLVNCTAYNNQRAGLYLAGADKNILTSCQILSNSQYADLDSPNIIIGASSSNTFNGCIVRHGGGTKQADYGICVLDTLCVNNSIKNCDLIDSGKTAAYSDGGTGTVFANNET